MSDKEQRRRYPAMAAFYAQYLPALTKRAREHGYCLAVHGSMATDVDLLAVPWTPDASPAEDLVESIRSTVDGHIPTSNDPAAADDPYSDFFKNPVERPHGRRAWSIYLNPDGWGPYIDLSIMPLAPEVSP